MSKYAESQKALRDQARESTTAKLTSFLARLKSGAHTPWPDGQDGRRIEIIEAELTRRAVPGAKEKP